MKTLLLATVALAAATTGAQAANTVITASPAVQSATVGGVVFSTYNNPSESGGGGFTVVNGARPDTLVGGSDNGSLEIRGDKSRYVIGNLFGTAASPGFLLSSLSSMTFDWNVDVNGSGQAHAAPAARVIVADANNVRVELNWEYVYNGGTSGVNAPTDQWFNADAGSVFYANLRSGGITNFRNDSQTAIPNAAVIGGGAQGVIALNGNDQSNLTLASWSRYFTADAKVVGISFGAGSGFGGNFVGYVDNVNVNTTSGTDNLNFEAQAAAVPEPATWGMMILGFGLVGASVRRRTGTMVAA